MSKDSSLVVLTRVTNSMQVILHNLSTGQKVSSFVTSRNAVKCITFNPRQPSHMGCVSESGHAFVWDINKLSQVKIFICVKIGYVWILDRYKIGWLLKLVIVRSIHLSDSFIIKELFSLSIYLFISSSCHLTAIYCRNRQSIPGVSLTICFIELLRQRFPSASTSLQYSRHADWIKKLRLLTQCRPKLRLQSCALPPSLHWVGRVMILVSLLGQPLGNFWYMICARVLHQLGMYLW